jgi:hypothetical protein
MNTSNVVIDFSKLIVSIKPSIQFKQFSLCNRKDSASLSYIRYQLWTVNGKGCVRKINFLFLLENICFVTNDLEKTENVAEFVFSS